MSQRELDKAVAQILHEEVDEKIIRDSASRVFVKLFDSTYIASGRVEKIRTCEDIQLLIPDYRSGQLPPSRVMLVEDHVLGCPGCRRVLHPPSEARPASQKQSHSKLRTPYPLLAWSLAASLIAGIAIGATGIMRGIFPWQHKLQATVESVEGSLYRVSELGASLIEAGAIITNADELRTVKGTRAILRLAGGAKLELAERSDVTMAAAWHGTDVNLERGRMIVQSANTAQQTFYVSSGDLIIPVHGAVLALDHGSKGSRLSVAKGSTQLERGRLRNTVFAGQQYATSNAVFHVPVASEFAWSQNSEQYLALLSELSNLQKSLQSIPSPGLRYASSLARYLPPETMLYAAIPNLGATITQAKQMFDSRLAESDVLRAWWQRQPIAQNGEFDRLLSQIGSVSSYLGDEIVLAMTSNGDRQYSEPVFLAEIRQPGLASYIEQNFPANSGIQILTSAAAPAGKQGRLFVELDNNVLVASTSPERIRQIEKTVQAPSSSEFVAKPLFMRVKEVYSEGAAYFLAADLEQMIKKSVDGKGKTTIATGLDNARFLVLERKDLSGASAMRAALTFDGTRQGIATWLASPGPAGSLDFVSPDAGLAASMVMKNPRSIVQELISYGSVDGGFAQQLKEFERRTGVSLLDDVAGALGSDVTFAIDGPGLPTAAWKLAIEVYDPERLKLTLATFVDHFNQQAVSAGTGTLQLTNHQIGALAVYSLSYSKSPAFSVAYTFVDGYLVAAAGEGNLSAAIQNKQMGRTLATSSIFRAKLPADGYTNFSAMFYQNIGNTLGPLAEQMKSSNALNPRQRQTLSAILTNSGPGLICVYGERDRIIAASTGSFLGFDLGTLAGLYQGKPIAPLIASNTSLLQSKTGKPN